MQRRLEAQAMTEFSRRKFIATSAMGASAGVLAGAATMRDVLAQTQSVCGISANFNGTPIPGGNGEYIWFNNKTSSVPPVFGRTADDRFLRKRRRKLQG